MATSLRWCKHSIRTKIMLSLMAILFRWRTNSIWTNFHNSLSLTVDYHLCTHIILLSLINISYHDLALSQLPLPIKHMLGALGT